jgi:hypothetical protein
VTVDGYDMWEIQALLAMRTDKRTRYKQTLVLWLWQGFGVENVTWESVENLPKSVLNDYYVLQQQDVVMFSEQDDDSDAF